VKLVTPTPHPWPSFIAGTEPPAVTIHKHADGGFTFSHDIQIGSVWRHRHEGTTLRVVGYADAGILVCEDAEGTRTWECPVWLIPVYGPAYKVMLVVA
jgi:hypothetical protein